MKDLLCIAPTKIPTVRVGRKWSPREAVKQSRAQTDGYCRTCARRAMKIRTRYIDNIE